MRAIKQRTRQRITVEVLADKGDDLGRGEVVLRADLGEDLGEGAEAGGTGGRVEGLEQGGAEAEHMDHLVELG